MSDPVARLGQLLDLETETLADRPARAIATYMAEILDRFEGDTARLQSVKLRIKESSLPADAKETILARMPPTVP